MTNRVHFSTRNKEIPGIVETMEGKELHSAEYQELPLKYHAPTALPPSISRLIPVTNFPSSLPRYKHIFATSSGSVNLPMWIRSAQVWFDQTLIGLPSGTLKRNFLMFSSVAGTPTKLSNKGVAERSGHKALTRMPSLPYSAASPLVA